MAAVSFLSVYTPSPVPDADDREPDDEHQDRQEHHHVHQHVPRMCEWQGDHWFACERSQRPKVVNPTITQSIQYWDWVATRAFL
jgi:hypothetical protein